LLDTRFRGQIKSLTNNVIVQGQQKFEIQNTYVGIVV